MRMGLVRALRTGKSGRSSPAPVRAAVTRLWKALRMPRAGRPEKAL